MYRSQFFDSIVYSRPVLWGRPTCRFIEYKNHSTYPSNNQYIFLDRVVLTQTHRWFHRAGLRLEDVRLSGWRWRWALTKGYLLTRNLTKLPGLPSRLGSLRGRRVPAHLQKQKQSHIQKNNKRGSSPPSCRSLVAEQVYGDVPFSPGNAAGHRGQ